MVNMDNVIVTANDAAEQNGCQLRNPLLDIPTCDLVEELLHRPGCLYLKVEPHGRGTIGVDGPATCIVVLD